MKTKPLREITKDELQRFLQAKTNGDACMSCGQSTWIFDGGSEGLYPGWIWGSPKPTEHTLQYLDPSKTAVPLLVMTCINCGFQRAHDVHIVAGWIDDHPERGEK